MGVRRKILSPGDRGIPQSVKSTRWSVLAALQAKIWKNDRLGLSARGEWNEVAFLGPAKWISTVCGANQFARRLLSPGNQLEVELRTHTTTRRRPGF